MRKLLLLAALVAASCAGPAASPGRTPSPVTADSSVASAAGSPQLDVLPGEPDPTLTPGALNPAVTQATIGSTICVRGWTATIRPDESYTYSLKVRQIREYGYTDTRVSSYEEDHLVPLGLGGAPKDPRNLWPQPLTISLADGRPAGADITDDLEGRLNRDVCSGTLPLAAAQLEMLHWVHAWYGIPLPGSTPGMPAFTARPTAHYWFCWDLGSPAPHHLGHDSSGDHACSDSELRAAGLLP